MVGNPYSQTDQLQHGKNFYTETNKYKQVKIYKLHKGLEKMDGHVFFSEHIFLFYQYLYFFKDIVVVLGVHQSSTQETRP